MVLGQFKGPRLISFPLVFLSPNLYRVPSHNQFCLSLAIVASLPFHLRPKFEVLARDMRNVMHL